MSEEYIEVAKTSQIDDGQLMHIEISDKEILIANINGKFYAMDDRCSHMNARLSLGNISKNIVTCPFHAAKFEVTSGKKIDEPVLSIPPRNGTTTTELEKIHGLRR
ncbi:MAG: Rieske 2Fe-2S domain-containing protein [Nitrososphaeraceae archaeon]